MGSSAQRPLILLVGRNHDILRTLKTALNGDCLTEVALDGESALHKAVSAIPPDLILLSPMPRGMDEFEVCRRLKADAATSAIPVIFLASDDTEDKASLFFDLGAEDFITGDSRPTVVRARVQHHLRRQSRHRELENMVWQRTQELRQTRIETIRGLGRAAEFQDKETSLHVRRMAQYSRIIAEGRNLGEQWSSLILTAAPMHDIGKIGIPDRILLKPGALNSEEWEIMQRHPCFGAEIIGDHPSILMKIAREIALTHHEKWNGSGYPRGLSGEDIPLSGRIVTIADVFDALTSERPYKAAWPVQKAIEHIAQNAGIQFDPNLARVFVESMPRILDIKKRYADGVLPVCYRAKRAAEADRPCSANDAVAFATEKDDDRELVSGRG